VLQCHCWSGRRPAAIPGMIPVAALPSVVRAVDYMERMPKNLIAAMFTWADAESFGAFPDLYQVTGPGGWDPSITWVMATNTLEISSRAPVHPTEMQGDGPPQVSVEVFLTRVGNSSWESSFVVREARTQQIVGRIVTVNVCVLRADIGVGGSTTLPRRETLMECVVPQPAFDLQPARSMGTKPTDARVFVWTSAIRATDCDSLGHLNNTRYATMAEEALAHASFANAFDSCGSASADGTTVAELADMPIRSCHIEYKAQLLPYRQVEASVWWDAEQHAFVVVLETVEVPRTLGSFIVLGAAVVRHDAQQLGKL
jgi:acyl-CoA thioesterase FadM